MSEPESTSIWKKEIRLGGSRQPAPPRDPDAPESTSIWKKELHLGGGPRDSDAPPSTSVWKKEIRIGRRPRLEAALEEAMETDPSAGDAPTIGKQSLWKKEFHIGSAPGDDPSFWKKDIRVFPPGFVESAAQAPSQAEPPTPVAPEPVAEPQAEWAPPKQEEHWIDPVPAPAAGDSMLEHLSVAPRPGVTLDEIDARLDAAKAVLARVESLPAVAAPPEPPPAPEEPVAAVEPPAPDSSQARLSVTLEEIDARLEAAKAVIAAAEAEPAPVPEMFKPAPAVPEPAVAPEPTQPPAPALPPIATLAELDARIEAAKAAALARELEATAPPVLPEPQPTPDPPAQPAPLAAAAEPMVDPQADLKRVFEERAESALDEIDARLAAAKAAFASAMSPGSAPARPPQAVEPVAVAAPQPEAPAPTVVPTAEAPQPEAPVPTVAPPVAAAELVSEPKPVPFWKKEIGRSSKPKAAKVPKAKRGSKAAAVEPAAAVAPVERAPKPASQPFWKKEISLGRSSTPKAAKTPKAERAPKAASQPFWKKEISLGRSSKPVPVPAPAPVELPVAAVAEPAAPVERAPKPASQPFWKKEISLGRSSSKPKAAKASKASKSPKAERAPKAASQPFWKKEIGRSSKPKTQQAPKAERAPKAASQPFWKKELSLGRSAKPKAPKAARAPRVKGGAHHDHPLVELVGLRIGSSQLAAAVVNNNGSAELLQLASTPLEPGLVTAGEVRDPAELAKSLKRFFAQNKLPRSGVRLGVATNRIGVRVLEVPSMDDPKLLENAIRFRAQEVLPFPLADAVLDHVLLGEATDATGEKHQRVLLVFAHRELVEGYLDACQRAGLKLVGIDFEAFALLRALSAREADHEPTAALVAVAIGRERTIFAVSDGATCDFARVLEWGGASLDAALGAALKLEPEDAERLKRTLALEGDGPVGALSATEVEVGRAALREELQVLARELVSSLQFYQSRPESLDIGEVLLTGGGAQLMGIESELGRQLGVPIRLADPLGGVSVDDSLVIPADAGSVAIAVGLGMES